MASKKKGAKRRASTATKKRKANKPKRRITKVLLKKSEIKQIREFSKFAPGLDKLRGRDKITSAEYGVFTKAKRRLRHTGNLKPVTEKQAKALKGHLVGGGIRAVRLRNTEEHAKVRVRKGGIIVTSNGRDWEYHPVGGGDPSVLAENLIEKGRDLFNRDKNPPFSLYIWTSKGRASEGFRDFGLWARYVGSRFNSYQNASEFIWGIAALVKDKGGKVRKPLKRKIPAFIPDDIEEEEDE